MIKINEFPAKFHNPVHQFILENKNRMQIHLTDFGARITGFIVPDKKGVFENVSLSFKKIEDYKKYDIYFGATIGRVAGRMKNAEFSIDGKTYFLPKNDGFNLLHGGTPSFESRIWKHEIGKEVENQIIFTYISPDGENQFPGNLVSKVIYTLDENNTLHIKYEATTDQPTLYNPTNHIYFSLSGDFSRSVEDHILKIDADYFAVLDEENLPTGELRSVKDTPFNLKEGRKLTEVFSSDYDQIRKRNGFDHPFLLNESHFAEISHPESGRKISMHTTAPSVVVYTASHTEGLSINGEIAQSHAGITLETQVLPDAVHHKNFGNIVLYPSETFSSETHYHFSLE